MTKLIYLTLEDQNGARATTCKTWDQVHAVLSSPAVTPCFIFDFKIKGRNYQERKNYARNMAQFFQSSAAPGLYWSELAELGAAWEKIARRYGLIDEFKNEGLL